MGHPGPVVERHISRSATASPTQWGDEFALLLATTRWPTPVSLVRELAARVSNWDHFIALGMRHRVLGLSWHGLSTASALLPDPVSAKLRIEAARIRLEEVGYAAEAQRLQKRLTDAGVQSSVLKGVVNAELAFGRLGLRVNRDLDLLVDPAGVDAAAHALQAQDYIRVEPPQAASPTELASWRSTHKDMVFQHPKSRRIVELHWRLFDNPYYLPLPAYIKTVRYTLESDIKITGLPSDFSIIYNCAHGSQHAWSRVKWLADISPVFSRLDGDSLMRLYALSRQHKADRSFKQAIWLCVRLMGLELPDQVARSLKQGPIDRLLERVALQAITASGAAEIEEQRFGTTQKNLSHYLLGRGVRYLLAEAHFDANDSSAAEGAPKLPWLGPLARPVLWVHGHLGKQNR